MASRENRSLLEDLSVGERDPYRLDTPAEHRNAKWFAAMVEQFVPAGKTIHLRVLLKNGANCSAMCPPPARYSTACSITPRLSRSTGAATDSSLPPSSHQAKSNRTTP